MKNLMRNLTMSAAALAALVAAPKTFADAPRRAEAREARPFRGGERSPRGDTSRGQAGRREGYRGEAFRGDSGHREAFRGEGYRGRESGTREWRGQEWRGRSFLSRPGVGHPRMARARMARAVVLPFAGPGVWPRLRRALPRLRRQPLLLLLPGPWVLLCERPRLGLPAVPRRRVGSRPLRLRRILHRRGLAVTGRATS